MSSSRIVVMAERDAARRNRFNEAAMSSSRIGAWPRCSPETGRRFNEAAMSSSRIGAKHSERKQQ